MSHSSAQAFGDNGHLKAIFDQLGVPMNNSMAGPDNPTRPKSRSRP